MMMTASWLVVEQAIWLVKKNTRVIFYVPIQKCMVKIDSDKFHRGSLSDLVHTFWHKLENLWLRFSGAFLDTNL